MTHHGSNSHTPLQQEFMKLGVEDGVEHLLDLSTGRLIRVLPAPLASLRRIAERSVTRQRIEGVLRAAAIPTSRDEEGGTIARLYGEDVRILISPERTFVRFVMERAVRPFVHESTLNATLRSLSNEYDVARFRCLRDGFVCADYAMSYEYGLSPQQMVEMLKGFTYTVQMAFESEFMTALFEG